MNPRLDFKNMSVGSFRLGKSIDIADSASVLELSTSARRLGFYPWEDVWITFDLQNDYTLRVSRISIGFSAKVDYHERNLFEISWPELSRLLSIDGVPIELAIHARDEIIIGDHVIIGIEPGGVLDRVIMKLEIVPAIGNSSQVKSPQLRDEIVRRFEASSP